MDGLARCGGCGTGDRLSAYELAGELVSLCLDCASLPGVAAMAAPAAA